MGRCGAKKNTENSAAEHAALYKQ
jgi:hypothetical protein